VGVTTGVVVVVSDRVVTSGQLVINVDVLHSGLNVMVVTVPRVVTVTVRLMIASSQELHGLLGEPGEAVQAVAGCSRRSGRTSEERNRAVMETILVCLVFGISLLVMIWCKG
jgi:hypothetical protein